MSNYNSRRSNSASATRRILIAIDGSEHSGRAVDWYAANMNQSDDELLFVYVVEPPAVSLATRLTRADVTAAYAKAVDKAVDVGHRLAASVREQCNSAGISQTIRFLERMGSKPGPALVEVANEERAGFIVLGSRGQSRVRRTFLGSVSEYVLHHAHRPVCIVPPPQPPSQPEIANQSASNARPDFNSDGNTS
ncbi:hypothetical protein BOX15_Mlig032787g2 [Macrostomum lignano]|uniref:UspA domain-containing protein n=1 Tax=Macrostomum lignano TaxID=282301 RepID=A0A267DRS3_9PLAT|nr:hypothetical protein BOX15_Mlig032787g2 [Macrostomum lignano]